MGVDGSPFTLQDKATFDAFMVNRGIPALGFKIYPTVVRLGREDRRRAWRAGCGDAACASVLPRASAWSPSRAASCRREGRVLPRDDGAATRHPRLRNPSPPPRYINCRQQNRVLPPTRDRPCSALITPPAPQVAAPARAERVRRSGRPSSHASDGNNLTKSGRC